MFDLFRRRFGGRHAPPEPRGPSRPLGDEAQPGAALSRSQPDWRDPLTAPLRAACEAPDEGAILVARRLYEEEKVAPLIAAESARRAAFAEVLEGFAELEAAVPGLRKAMLYRHPWMLRQLGKGDAA